MSIRTIRRRLAELRHDDTGAANLVIAYAILTAALLAGLSAFAMTNGMVGLSYRVTQAAEASVRATVDTVLAEVNQGGTTNPAALVTDLPGRTYELTPDGIISGETEITSAAFDGQEITLTLRMTSTGRAEWQRTGTATLKLAQATSLAGMQDGRAVWDFAPPSGANSYAEQVVALWTPGELSVYIPGTDEDQVVSANPAKITSNITAAGVATFVVEYNGGCQAGNVAAVEVRQVVPGVAQADWQAHTGSSYQATLAPGQTTTLEARTRCTDPSSGAASNWSMNSSRLTRAAALPSAPVVEITTAGNGQYTAAARLSDTAPAGATVALQLRVRVGTSDWTPWSAASSTSLTVPAGQAMEAQARVRVSTSAGDSGWVDGPIVTQANAQ